MKIAVVMGGKSSEHEVSLRSGAEVLNAIAHRAPIAVVIDRDGRWRLDDGVAVETHEAIAALVRDVDVAFLALHGKYGEDGCIQGLLEMAGVAYTGSGVLGSALCMDKVRTKLVYASQGLPTPRFVLATSDSWRVLREAILDRVDVELSYPCVVKPARAGSSVDVAFVADREALRSAMDALLASSDVALIEPQIKGREFTCGVLEDLKGRRTVALPVTEIIPDSRFAFFDYEAKYTPGATAEITPADIPKAWEKAISDYAVAAHAWLDCRDVSRTDLIVTPDGQVNLLETNTIPGLTKESLLPKAAACAGYSMRTVVELMIDNALARKRGRTTVSPRSREAWV